MNKDNYCLFPGCSEKLPPEIYWCHKHDEKDRAFKKGVFLMNRTKYLEIDKDIPGKE